MICITFNLLEKKQRKHNQFLIIFVWPAIVFYLIEQIQIFHYLVWKNCVFLLQITLILTRSDFCLFKFKISQIYTPISIVNKTLYHFWCDILKSGIGRFLLSLFWVFLQNFNTNETITLNRIAFDTSIHIVEPHCHNILYLVNAHISWSIGVVAI